MRIIGQEAAHSSPKPASASLFNRRDLIRAALFAGAASALGPAFSVAQAVSSGLTAAAKGEDGSTFLTDRNWKAAFLNDHQNVVKLQSRLVPNRIGPVALNASAVIELPAGSIDNYNIRLGDNFLIYQERLSAL